MTKISARLQSHFQKNLSSYPFSFKFDAEKLRQSADWEAQEMNFIDLISHFNLGFLTAMKKAMEVLRHHDYKMDELIAALFAKGNKHYAFVNNQVHQRMAGTESAVDYDRLKYLEISDYKGNPQNGMHSIEFLSELYGLLLTFQEEYDLLTQEYVPETDKKPQHIDIVIQYLIQMVNIIFNLRIAYNLMIYARVDVDLSDLNHPKLAAEDDGVNLLTSINETRSSSHFNEIFFPLYHAFKSRPFVGTAIDEINVNDGRIKIKVKEAKLDPINQAANLAKSAAFYEYLSEVKLEAFEGHYIEELLELTDKLSDLTTHHLGPSINPQSELSDIPYRINRTELINYLESVSEVGRMAIDNFISSLSNSKGGAIDFFRYPLYVFKKDIYLLFTALNAPHGHPFVERWLRISGISEADQKKLLADHVRKNLTSIKKLPKGIKWKVADHQSQLADNELCIETRDQLIIVSCQVFRFTGDKREEVTLLDEYAKVLNEFSERILDIQPYAISINKRIVPVCITSDVHYSGIILSRIPILDLTLFKNYMVLGQYIKVKMINDQKSPKISKLYDYQYYSSQDEFETNLVNFMYKPYPIYVILQKMEFRQAALIPPELDFQVSYYVSDMISLEEEEQDDLENLDHLMKAQLFINDNNPEYDQLVHNILSKTFNGIADRRSRNLDLIPEFVEKIARSNRISATHLAIYVRRRVETIKLVTKIPSKKYKAIDYQESYILNIYGQILGEAGSNSIQLSEFKINISLSEDEQQQLISAMVDQLTGITQQPYKVEEQEIILTNLAILGSLVKKPEEISLFFQAFGNFVESLNHNQDYQKARDVAFEGWLYSQKIGQHIYGMNILFKCYIRQKNFLYAGVYGGILISGLDSVSAIDKGLFIDILFNLFRYFREFNYVEFAKTVWKIAQKEKLEAYDDQKFSLAYFNLRLIGGLKNDHTLIGAVTKYLNKNLEKILPFGHHGCIPWLGLCLNFRRHGEILKISIPEEINLAITAFEKTINDKAIIENLKLQVTGESQDFKKEFIKMLLKVYSNVYYNDYKFNVLNLSPIADMAIQRGIDNRDFNLIMLSSLVFNDQQLNYEDYHIQEKTKRFDSEISRLEPSTLQNYADLILEKLNLSANQILIWLTETNNTVYKIIITSNKTIEIKHLEEWNPTLMSKWIRTDLPRFYFNSGKSKYYDLAAQELYTSELIKSLADFDLRNDQKADEVLILKSVDMSGYPDNLMINNGELLSRNTPICNILNLEYFLEHQDKTFIRLNQVNAWLPKIGKDGTISFGHDDLVPLLAEFNAMIIDEALLQDMPPGNVNIFMAHGNTGLDGFKSFQSEEDKYQFNFSMFGTGDIAILFICNSGNLRDDFQSQDIKSVGQELIKNGYKAVIAPFWKYDVTMSRIWLTEFFKVLQEGYSINQTVHLANRKVAEYDPETGRFFDEPGGWAAMHLYGNPNLYFEKS